MAGIEKIIKKMCLQPHGIRYSDAVKVLEAYGYQLVRNKGSHRHFRHLSGEVITIIEENPMKSVYIKDILRRIEDLKEIIPATGYDE